MTTHTPGPWRVEGRDIRQGQENLIAQVARQVDNNGGDDPIRNANARLIAAAPEVLEALVILVQRYCPTCKDSTCRWCLMARAAIDKAKGASA